jgi:Ras-related protein Rab-11A
MLKSVFQEKFDPKTEMTVGVDFTMKQYHMFEMNVSVQFWDIAGVSRFDFLREKFYRGAGSVILVGDLSRSSTFEDIGFFIETAQAAGIDQSRIILVGNKADLYNNRSNILPYLSYYVEEYRLAELIETSARFKDNLELIFEFSTVLAMYERNLIDDLYLTAYKEELNQLIINPVFVPELKTSRYCWNCDKRLHFSEFSTSNHKLSRERLITLWESDHLEFVCCDCYNKLNRNKKKLIAS